jgi:Uma2 family endonuclease
MVVRDLDPELLADLDELHDDSEEDLVGADWHQTAIRVANEGLLLAGPERGLPWHVGNQLTVLMGRVGRKEWRPSPDLFVHPRAGPEPVKSFDARLLGVPPLVIEVVSEDTWRYDVAAKRRTYGRVGVQEYLVFDPTREWLGEAVRAWHATPRGFVRWAAGRDGRWHSRVLGIASEPDGLLLRVVDAAGARMLHVGEQARRLREQAHRIAELEAENRRLRGAPE